MPDPATKPQEIRRIAASLPYARIVRKVTTMGVGCSAPPPSENGSVSDGLISMCGRKAGTMDEIAGLRARRVFARAPQRTRRCPTAHRRSSAARRDDGARPGFPNLTWNSPPHSADWMPSCGATAARRTSPAFCAVARSNPAGLTDADGGIVGQHVP